MLEFLFFYWEGGESRNADRKQERREKITGICKRVTKKKLQCKYLHRKGETGGENRSQDVSIPRGHAETKE